MVLLFVALFWIFLYGVKIQSSPQLPASSHYISRAREETGAINAVSSIYLGYRAFDTLGETVVLILTVASVISLVKEV